MRREDPGYGIEPAVFDVQELADVGTALASVALQRIRAGARHVLALPPVRALADDVRMLHIEYASSPHLPNGAELLM